MKIESGITKHRGINGHSHKLSMTRISWLMLGLFGLLWCEIFISDAYGLLKSEKSEC